MIRKIRPVCRLSLIASIGAALLPVVVFGQTTDRAFEEQRNNSEVPATTQGNAAQTRELAPIVVTARKQDELLQAVPLTVFAFSTAQLESIAPKTLFDLTLLAPGLNYQEISGGRAGDRK